MTDYVIQSIASPPKQHLPWYHTPLRRFKDPAIQVLQWVLTTWLVYLLWRTTRNKVSAWLFLLAHASQFLAQIVESSWKLLTIRLWPHKRDTLRLVGDNVPSVNVIITTCGESLEVVLDTLKAACVLDYPADRYRVLIADDGASNELQQAVQRLNNAASCQLLYHARSSNTGAKAGNMNAAVRYLNSLDEKFQTEFYAFADVDMILEPQFLRACLPHLLSDENAGVCVTPQRFYNMPTNDPIYQSLNSQIRGDTVLRDAIKSASNSGPGAIFRRTALEQINGGFPEEAIAEDTCAGFLFNGKGWHVVCCSEELQWGLIPDTMNGHIAQRSRWIVGQYRNSQILNYGFNFERLPMMTWKQRVVAFNHCAGPIFATMNRFICAWVLLILAALDRQLIVVYSKRELQKIIWVYAGIQFLTRFPQLQATFESFRTADYAHIRRKEGTLWMRPHMAYAALKEIMPQRLGGIRIGFTPTARTYSSIRERDPVVRPRLLRRLWMMIRYQYVWYHIVMLVLSTSVLWWRISPFLMADPRQVQWEVLLTHVLAPGMDWETYACHLAPIKYALWPPTMETRRELMEKRARVADNFDGQTVDLDVWRCKEERKTIVWNAWTLLVELPYWISFGVLIAAVLGVSFRECRRDTLWSC